MIELGIIGTGGMAHEHARRLQRIKGVRIKACCDVVEQRARQFAGKFGIPETYTDYGEMLETSGVAGVVSVTPDSVHEPVALAAASAGVHILSEKPLSTTVESAERMVDAVQAAKVVHAVNFTYRNSSALQEVARRIQQGDIGTLRHVEASYLQSWLAANVWGHWKETPHLVWRTSRKDGNEGTLSDIGCHLIDATTFLAGEMSEVFCRLAHYDKGLNGKAIDGFPIDANDSFAASVTFANGAIGVLHSTRWASGFKNRIRFLITGTEGSISLEIDPNWSQFQICAGPDRHHALWQVVEAERTPNNWEHFVDAIRNGSRPLSDFSNGLRVQRYLQACMDSDARKVPIRIPN